MTYLNDSADGVVTYPPEVEADYMRRGAWRSGTIAGHLHNSATTWPDRPALICQEGVLTYAELDALTDRRAAGLLALGLPVGGRVLLQLHNRMSMVVAWYALLKAGLIPVCTLPLHRHHEISEIAQQTRPVAHFVPAHDSKFDLVDFARREAAEAGSDRLVVTCDGEGGRGTLAFDVIGDDVDPQQARRLVEDVQRRLGPQAVAVFQLSGGTTGIPKVIPCLQAGYWAYGTDTAAAMEWTAEDRVAYFGPLVHNAGIVIGLHGPHSVGAALVLGTPDLDSLFWCLDEGQATDVALGPFAYEAVHHPKMATATQLKRVLFAGKKVAERHFEALEARGIWAGQIFGMGEGLCAITPLSYPRAARLAGVGVPISEADEIRIYRPGTEEEVEPGHVGELCAKGPYTLMGYLDAPEHNRVAFTSDGFYRTGDLFADRVVDGVRCLTVEGRIKDMISRGGEKISTAEVEVLLCSHPRITEAVLVPVPDDRLGERACAFVSGVPGDEVDLAEVSSFLNSRGVAKYKWPELLYWLDEMPRASEVGKIDRASLRRRAEGLATGPGSH